MISDTTAIAQAQALYRALCERLKKQPRELVGEIAFLGSAKLAVLFDANGKLAGAYRVIDADRVVDLSGPELTKLRSRLSARKVRG